MPNPFGGKASDAVVEGRIDNIFKNVVRTIFRFLEVSCFSFMSFHLFSSVLYSVSVIAVSGIL